MADKSTFAEILEGKLEASTYHWSPSREFDTQPAHLAFLLGHVSKATQVSPPRKNPYPTPPARPPKAHVLTETQLKAQQFFLLWGEILTPAFSKAELKSAFRRLAKKLHPDLSKRSGSEFIQLREAFTCLISVSKK